MAWSYEILLFSKDFWNFNDQFGCIIISWYSRLTRMLFHYNARVRPSIICTGQDAMEQERSWSPRRIIHIYIYPLLWLYGFVWLVNVVCMRYYNDMMYKTDIVSFCVKIYYLLLYLFRCDCEILILFGFFFFYLFFFNPNGS